MDDRTEPKIPKFRCFGNFGSVRFGSVRLKYTEPKQIEEFRFNNKLKLHIGSEICKKFRSKSVYGILYKSFFVKLNTNDFFTLEFAKNECDIAQNQCIWKVEFRFGSFGFGSASLTEISVSVVSVFTCFGRPLKRGAQ